MNRRYYLSLLILPVTILNAQVRIGTGLVAETYQQYCQVCHGEDLRGGALGPSLVDDEWVHGSTNEDISRVIREGVPSEGMTAYAGVLSEKEIRAMVIYLREMAQVANTPEPEKVENPDGLVVETRHHPYRLEKVVELPGGKFWSVSFLPDEAMLLSDHSGDLYIVRDGVLGDPIEGLPEVHFRGQAGLMEVQAHPDYADNGWIYLGFSDYADDMEGGQDSYMTAIVRGRVRDGKWVDEEEIWRAATDFYTDRGHHFGTRFVFKDGYLYFSVGDRGQQDQAQDLNRPNGKVHRIHDDGRIPDDNPFANQEGRYPTIWTYGNRNPQGLDMHPLTGEIWETEHGPRGGDELNILRKGANYGWPAITYGMNYNGRPITEFTSAPGMEQPIHHWTPSIAVCGMDFYEGDAFPEWKYDLFVTGMITEQLDRFKLEGTTIVEHEVVLKGHGRVRDVSTGPDGFLYVILNLRGENDRATVFRLVPAS